tara:strand:+ start:161 stop:880 length:720 start_codon:yes stop_codon:yes gene_type:complete
MTEYKQDNVRLNPGVGGANIATDFLGSFGAGGSQTGAHVQVVKVAYGGFNSAQLVTQANPYPVRIFGLDPGFLTLPVGGNSQGGAIPVTGDVGVNAVNVTFDAVSGDIRHVSSGVTFGVVNHGGTTLDVSNSRVQISGVDLPTGLTMGTQNVDTSTLLTLPGFTCETGIKIKNFAGFTAQGGAILTVGQNGLVAGATTGAFVMQVGEEIFIEIDNINKLRFSAIAESGDTNSVFTYQAS